MEERRRKKEEEEGKESSHEDDGVQNEEDATEEGNAHEISEDMHDDGDGERKQPDIVRDDDL